MAGTKQGRLRDSGVSLDCLDTVCQTPTNCAANCAANREAGQHLVRYDTVKRLVDFSVALALLALLSPLMLLVALALLVKNRKVCQTTANCGRVLARTPRAGLDCRIFNEYSFAQFVKPRQTVMNGSRVRYLPLLLNVLKGDISFIGPRAADLGEFCPECALMLRQPPDETLSGKRMEGCRVSLREIPGSPPRDLTAREVAARKRNQVRPGIFCDWWILKRANMAYDHEAVVDSHYVDECGFRKDVGILFRALPSIVAQALFGSGSEESEAPDVLSIMDIRIDNLTMRDTLDEMLHLLDQDKPHQVCFVNPQCVNVAYNDRAYRAVLSKAHLVLSDGIGMKIAGRILGRTVRQNVNGTDLFPRLCGALAGAGKSIYLLGARPGVGDAVRAWITRNHPGTRVAGCQHGYFTADQEQQVIGNIAESGADVLLVAMGVPAQDLWINRNLERLGVKVALGVGGLFDFYSGRIPRAPLWVREIGMEWFYRFWQEPARMWRRYFVGNGQFLFRVCRERLTGRTAPRHSQ